MEEGALYDLLQGVALRFFYAPSLRIPIRLLNQLGAVIVAAAGNDSAERYGNLPMNVPARFPEVIGVGASNVRGEISNFSNLGDILAPGGGHTEPDYPFTDIKTYVEPGEDLSPYSVISLVPEAEDNRDGLAFWVGTSFSAPLVSGLVALIQEKCRNVPAAGAPTPDEILEQIRAYSRNNVIDVISTLRG
jgi:subtilisin family serine protease